MRPLATVMHKMALQTATKVPENTGANCCVIGSSRLFEQPQVMRIRAYEHEDRERVLEVWLAASRHGHSFLGEAVLQGQLLLVRDVYLTCAQTLVAVVDGRIEGFIGLLNSFIGGLFVDPAHHRSGIGRTLVAEAGRLRNELTVEVYQANTGARTFYERQGFVEIGRRDEDDEGRLLPLVRMRRAGR